MRGRLGACFSGYGINVLEARDHTLAAPSSRMRPHAIWTILAALVVAILATTTGRAAVSYELYQAQPGDTVDNVASRFGVAAEEIAGLNSLLAGQALPAGLTLAIPIRRSAPQLAPPSPLGNGSPEQVLSNVRTVGPRFAVVADGRAEIVSMPGGGHSLFRPSPGARLVVTGESGDYHAVLMVGGGRAWIAKSSVKLEPDGPSPQALGFLRGGGRPDIVQEALTFLGLPYRLGGTPPGSADCSSLVQAAFSARGIRLPRTVEAQYEVGSPVSFSELLPGDRVYFVNKSGKVGHTGIHIGGGSFVHASSRRNQVAIDSLLSGTYWAHFLGGRRS